MIKTYTFLSAILADNPFTVNDGKAAITAAQLDCIEDALAEKDRLCNEQKKTIGQRDATIADLQAKLAAKPATYLCRLLDGRKRQRVPRCLPPFLSLFKGSPSRAAVFIIKRRSHADKMRGLFSLLECWYRD